MPSKYIRLPKKQPDKMGFDEVRNASWEMDPLATLCECHHHRMFLRVCVGVYDKPEEANGPPGAHAEGLVRAKDFMQGC